MNTRKTVVLGILGNVLDAGFHQERWAKWRPTVSLCRHADLPIARFELLHQARHEDLARCVAADIGRVSAGTEARLHVQEFRDPWDFEEVFAALHEFASKYPFVPEDEDYLVHITTGTHVQQICLFLLTESRHFPARLVQTSPKDRRSKSGDGVFSLIDLDLSRYDRIAARFRREATEGRTFLKSGIATRNGAFNRMIEQIEQVSVQSREPLLLTGPTGAGKSRLARRIYELKKARHRLAGPFVEVNCATLRGDAAMSALFGHVKGAFTGAVKERAGLLRSADGGLLFLDEIGELGLDEQAMLLRALEEKRFLPFGGDEETSSDFQLIAGTNRDLRERVAEGRFREDLLARIDLWTYRLPGLRERPEDIAPNLDHELEQATRRLGTRVTMSREVRERFLAFATSPEAKWNANFRDLNAAVTRMGTLAEGGRITAEILDDEFARLRGAWTDPGASGNDEEGSVLREVMGDERMRALDLFDRVQLACVVETCRRSTSLSDAGRALFGVSRLGRRRPNDADRLGKYLARFGLSWADVGPRVRG
ncbi:MAG: sigma 54-interacting transcriptional regulator [Verrucomicrobiales bacterium]|nr:sigma 54-interacting transcriptional regulator [Verrucomicrobiales bacterium]